MSTGDSGEVGGHTPDPGVNVIDISAEDDGTPTIESGQVAGPSRTLDPVSQQLMLNQADQLRKTAKENKLRDALTKMPFWRAPAEFDKYFNYLGHKKDSNTPLFLCALPGCTATISTTLRAPKTNLKRHLDKVHKIQAAEPTKQKQLSILASSKLPKGVNKVKTLYNRKDNVQVLFNSRLMDFIFVGGRPFNTTTDVTFIRLVRMLDYKIRIPSPRCLTRWLTKEAAKKAEKRRAHLQSTSVLHFCVDIWSTKLRESVLGIKVQYLDDTWKLHNDTLGFITFSDDHTGENIKHRFQDILKDNGIRQTQVGIIITDNASNVIKAFGFPSSKKKNEDDDSDSCNEDEDDGIQSDSDEEYETDDDIDNEAVLEPGGTDLLSEFNSDDTFIQGMLTSIAPEEGRFSCVAHSLQLAVRDAIDADDDARAIINAMKRIVSFFSFSPKWTAKLLTLTGGLHLIKPGETRWNSILFALQRICDPAFANGLRNTLIDAKRTSNKCPAAFRTSESASVCSLVRILKPVQILTDRLQADCVTSSLAIPEIMATYKEIYGMTNERFSTLRKKLLKNIEERLTNIFSSRWFILATVLDPRYKMLPFEVGIEESPSLQAVLPSPRVVLALLNEEYEKLKPTSELPSSQSDSLSEISAQSAESQSQTGFFRFVKRTKATDAETLSVVELYLREDNSEEGFDPLISWKKYQERFGIVSIMAMKYLSFPATTGSVERIFSVAGAIQRSRRSSISVNRVGEVLLFREERLRELEKYLSDLHV